MRPLREGVSGATLLERCDRTRTPMGARLLREWLSRPLVAPARIAARHDAVAELLADPEFRGDLVERLAGRGDVARIQLVTDGLGNHQWAWAAWGAPRLEGDLHES